MKKFQIQKASSTVSWTGKKILGLHTGTIDIAGGYLELNENQLTGGEVQIDMTSIVVTDIEDSKTNKEFLDHLLSHDFFGVDTFKMACLRINGADTAVDGKSRVHGSLSIKDIAHPVTFTASIEVFTDYLHSLGEIVVDRTLYDIRYGSGKFLANLGDKLIHDEFVLQFKLIAQYN